jgi:diaminohydroxyphosphoribosylaminopyrimidine deaminase / 5-amino-6-(5-phosphoribosylamino)uracil reductase
VTTPADAAFMRRALALAQQGRGATHPNPLVGAVVVQHGRVVGEGWHSRFGGPHAEVLALQAAGDDARGATLYVTLEPCAHHGRTPPCTDAVIAAGIARVVFAAADPNPVAAGGTAVLEAAGIIVHGGVEEDAARSQNAVFLHAHERSTPYVALKLAVSLDAALAAAPGRRTQLTGADAMTETHRLRASHDAVLIGSGTARTDDPLLTVRAFTPHRQPARVVLDTDATLSTASQLAASVAAGDVFVVAGDDVAPEQRAALDAAGISLRTVPRAAGGVDLAAALAVLRHEGIRSILVEGGATLAAALLRDGLVNRIHLFVAPLLLGPGAVPAFPVAAPLDGWRCVAADRCGDDALLVFDPAENH